MDKGHVCNTPENLQDRKVIYVHNILQQRLNFIDVGS